MGVNKQQISHCYKLIKKVYKDKKAKRSQVPLMNHIDEGLVILREIKADPLSYCAYCLHPLVQSDKDFKTILETGIFSKLKNSMISYEALALAIEYRNVANSFLSPRVDTISTVEKVELQKRLKASPLLKDMLIADKVQNKKDFELYHRGKHPRTYKLARYFDSWLHILEISEGQYDEFVTSIEMEDLWESCNYRPIC